MQDIDLSRAPRGLMSAQTLIDSVVERGDMAERHYLELKSSLNLSTKRDKEKIAKFILGAANRMPDVASTAFEGHCVMIAGVAEGTVTGIAPVEMMEISKTVQKFIGAAGPRWDVVWVPVEQSTNQVLVILVDPPMNGQAPFLCRASGDSLIDGRIYIRAEGETREANSDEVDLLIQRGRVDTPVEIDFAVEISGEIAAVSIDENSTVDEFVNDTRERLYAALPNEGLSTRGAASGLSARPGISGMINRSNSMMNSFSEPERRSRPEYIKAIDQWADDFRSAWPAAVQGLAGSQLSPAIFRILNRTSTFFHDVEVNIHLEGDIWAIDYLGRRTIRRISDLDLPCPPQAWGPKQRAMDSLVMPNRAYIPNQSTYIPPSITYKNGGSVTVEIDVGELRPRGNFESEDEELVLVVADPAVSSIHGTWELTARDHNEVYSGEFDVVTAGKRDLTSVARTVLDLESIDGEQSDT